ncbi:MAG: ACT domain-containing protein [Candidatus Rokubacteria bacterium]|nr:ACT domain-containing protein [Candidatus Rokubacteria bacterium]
MGGPRLLLSLLPDTFAICRLDKGAPIPAWALEGTFVSITRTLDEVSIVCSQVHVPEGVKCESGWRCVKVEGPLSFSLTGVLASIATPLSRAGISVFAVSTYDTDCVLVKENDLNGALLALSQEGHTLLGRG